MVQIYFNFDWFKISKPDGFLFSFVSNNTMIPNLSLTIMATMMMTMMITMVMAMVMVMVMMIMIMMMMIMMMIMMMMMPVVVGMLVVVVVVAMIMMIMNILVVSPQITFKEAFEITEPLIEQTNLVSPQRVR